MQQTFTKQLVLPAKNDKICVDLRGLEQMYCDAAGYSCVIVTCESIAVKCDCNISIVRMYFEDRNGKKYTVVDGKQDETFETIITSNNESALISLEPNQQSESYPNTLTYRESFADAESEHFLLFLHKYMQDHSVTIQAHPLFSSSDSDDEEALRIATAKSIILKDNTQNKVLHDSNVVEGSMLNVIERNPLHSKVGTKDIRINGTNSYALNEQVILDELNTEAFVKGLALTDKFTDMKFCIETDLCSKERTVHVKFVDPVFEKHITNDTFTDDIIPETTEEINKKLLKATLEQVEALNKTQVDEEE